MKSLLFNAVTMAIALLFGVGLLWLNIPIPFMLGSVLMVVLAYKCNIKLQKPNIFISRWMRVIIGVSLGGSVAGNLSLFSFSTLSTSIFAMAFTTIVTLIGMRLFRQFSEFDDQSRFVAALPGGLSFLISLIGDLGDKFPRVALVHATRIVTLVFSLSAMAYFLGVDENIQGETKFYSIHFAIGLLPITITIIAAGFIAEAVKIPGGHVILGLVLSSLGYIFGLIQEPMPELMITLAMTFLGLLIGVALMSGSSKNYSKTVSYSIAFTFIALAIAALIAFGIVQEFDERFLVIFLALAPGGIAEISLIALALKLDAGFVVVVHACRFFFIIFAGSFGLKFLQKREKTKLNK